MLLTDNNIKSELSYAYLHAISAKAGIACEIGGRHSDGAGVDAILRIKERFAPESTFTQFTIEVQLKATSAQVEPNAEGKYPYVLTIEHYNKLRDSSNQALHILVVFFMPPDPEHWLTHSVEGLTSRRCAYWVSLRNAPPSDNATNKTVYIPQANHFDVANLRNIARKQSLGEWINYEL